MNKRFVITSILLILVSCAVFLFSSYSQQKLYSEHSIESNRLCLENATKNNSPIYICSHISSAASEAYYSATTFYNPIIIFLILTICFLVAAIFSVIKELKTVKEKLNA